MFSADLIKEKLSRGFAKTKGGTAISIIGLGYVGKPLVNILRNSFSVIGYDIDKDRVADLNLSYATPKYSSAGLVLGNIPVITDSEEALKDSNFAIITVQTPVTKSNKPDLRFVRSAFEVVGRNCQRPFIVCLESTVSPGTTELMAKEILEKKIGLKRGIDFKIAYSPERVSPGDKEHDIEHVVKLISAEDEDTLRIVEHVYLNVANVYCAVSIKVAEAAKLVENTQRMVNIALMNELAMGFDSIGVDIQEVLKAAGTKWNFHKYQPGLVGGHCIPVDPYYLLNAFEKHRRPERPSSISPIASALNTIEDYPLWIVDKVCWIIRKAKIKWPRVLILGYSFKKDIDDARGSKVKDICKRLRAKGVKTIEVWDNYAQGAEWEKNNYVRRHYPAQDEPYGFDVIILAVDHTYIDDVKYDGKEGIAREFGELTKGAANPIFIDIPAAFSKDLLEGYVYWRP